MCWDNAQFKMSVSETEPKRKKSSQQSNHGEPDRSVQAVPAVGEARHGCAVHHCHQRGPPLTLADLLVFTELFWKPGELTQAEEWLRGHGESSSGSIPYLVGRGKVDATFGP